jgi:GR25 family glycosyltransferase involved in LPS biosynthesis
MTPRALSQTLTTVVINLDRATDRWASMAEHLDGFRLSYQRFSAVDEVRLTFGDLSDRGVRPMPRWWDPRREHTLTAGELGCAISHLEVWAMVAAMDAETNEPVLVLEDDVRLVDDFDQRLNLLLADLTHIEWDLVYLAARHMNEPVAVTSLVERPTWAWWACAYILTPRTAQLLVTEEFRRNLVPVDEYLPCRSDSRVPSRLDETFGHLPKLSILSSVEQIAAPGPHSANSTIETTDELIERLLVLSVASEPVKAGRLVRSTAKAGLNLELLGTDQPWFGGDMTGPGGGQKVALLRERLATIDDSAIVLFVDGYDVVVVADARALIERYCSFDANIVMAAEVFCWPDAERADDYPPAAGSYRFVNSGSFIGPADELRKLVARPIALDSDDQRYFTDAFLGCEHDMVLDTTCQLFQTMSGATSDVVIRSNRFFNVSHLTHPVVIHGNGHAPSKLAFDALVDRWATPRSDLLVNLLTYEGAKDTNNAWSIPAPDILQASMVTPGFCTALIEAAESIGEWQSLDGDVHPASELRVARISPRLVDNIADHIATRLVPWVNQHFAPLNCPGVKDMFIVKYNNCVDQPGLALHSDAATITVTIRLNEGYVGGQLEFPRQLFRNDAVPVGTALVWPSSVTHPHQSLPVTAGTKYTLTTWLA